MESNADVKVVNMNDIALFIGIVLALVIILRFKIKRLEKKQYPYALLTATFPLYYIGFALFSNDFNALKYESVFAGIFILLDYLSYKQKRKWTLALLGILSIFHAIYDYYHDHLFSNAGTPVWWIEFCASIDLILGSYLLYLFWKIRRNKLRGEIR